LGRIAFACPNDGSFAGFCSKRMVQSHPIMNLAKPFKPILRISSLGLNTAGIAIKTDWIFEEDIEELNEIDELVFKL
jgi:hypothetical protein